MTQCEKCLKKFRDTFTLKRHMSRIKPCNEEKKPPLVAKFSSLDPKITSSDPKITSSDPKITSSDPKITSSENCRFCLNTFSTNWYKNKHQLSCKLKDDPVRLLEIEKGVNPDLNASKTECRFCNKYFFNSANLYRHFKSCKEREDYHKELLNLNQATATNNITINNNNFTIINNNSLNFGHFDNSHIPTDEIPDMCMQIIKKNKYDTIYYQAGLIMISYDKRLMENPVNHNAEIPSNFRGYSNIKTNKGIKRIKSKQVINKVSQVVSKKLLSQFKELEKIGKIKTDKSKDIMKHVDGLAEEGILVYSPESEDEQDIYDIRRKYTEYKMNETELWNDLISDSDDEF
jgi:hypothetical protein